MPTYDIRTKEGEEKEVYCSISHMTEMVDKGEWQIVHKQVQGALVTHVDGMLSKTSDGYKDLLKNIKKHSGRGNTINT